MKTISKFLIPSIFSILSVSCDSDDSNSDVKKENDKTEISIVGKWQLIESIDNGDKEQLTDCDLKSVIEFKDDKSFKEISVENSKDNNTNCEFDGFGISGTYELNSENVLIKNSTEVIAVPDELNNPVWIEEAKGKNDGTLTVSFENENLVITSVIFDGPTNNQEVKITSILKYKRTTLDFYTKVK